MTTQPRRCIKVNAITQAKLIAAMLEGDLSCQELAEETGLHYVTVLQYTRELHRAGAAHIVRYEPDARGRHLIRIYKIGRGTDAKRSGKLSSADRQARTRAKRHAQNLLAVSAGRGRFVKAGNNRLRFEEIPECTS